MVLTDNESEDDIPLAKVARKIVVNEDSQGSFGIQEESMDSFIDKTIKSELILETINKSEELPLDSNKTDVNLAKFDIYYEYEWPREKSGCFYVLEEFLLSFLKINPTDDCLKELDKRMVEVEEKEYLKQTGVLEYLKNIEEINVLLVEDAVQFMVEHYPLQFKEYIKMVHKKEMKKIIQKQELQRANALPGKRPSFMRRALKETVRYNSRLNTERKEERQAYFDLQTHIIHLPQKKRIYDSKRKPTCTPYPVALMPGQFQDYFKRYTAEELHQIPLHTVTKSIQDNRVRKKEEVESNKNDEDKELPKTEDEPMEENILVVAPDKDPFCGICKKGPDSNKKGLAEKLIHCSQCENSGHPSCLDMNRNLVVVIQTYPWQCMECKICTECLAPHDEESMMFCDNCDRGYHSYCVGLKEIPKGRWVCERCGKCTSCLIREPVPKGENGRWKNELTKPRDGSEPEFLQIHCHRCSKFFRKGNFCPVCLKVYGRDDELQSPMICCDMCDRWIHTDCDDIDDHRYIELSKDQKSSYTCILCRGDKEERMDAFHRKNR